MNNTLSSVTGYLTSLWNSEFPKIGHIFSKQSNPFQREVELAKKALNQQISDLLPNCSLFKATLSETKEGKLSLRSKLEGTVVFSDEKSMDEWLAEKGAVDIWEIEDRRDEESRTFYKLQKIEEWGYDIFETRDELFDQLREDYGVFWKLENLGESQTSYIRFKTGLFWSHYENVKHEDLTSVANSLELVNPNLASPSHASSRPSLGKTIAASVIGGLLLSAGKSWSSNQTSVSDAIATIKGTLGPTALKIALVFQMSAITAVGGQRGTFPGALLAGMMLLPELVKGQPLCPQLVGSYNTSGNAQGISLSGNHAYVAVYSSGLQIIDVSNVTNPTLAGFYDTPDVAVDVVISGNYAYVADRGSGLQIIDVSNVTNSTLAGSYDTPGMAYGIAISGNYAYVADGSSLQIIDVSNITTPTLVGVYNISGDAKNIAISGNYAYVADGTSGLQIVDVSNVSNPTLAGSCDTPYYAQGIVVFGNYAYVADGTSGLQIIDVNNVTNPTLTGLYDTPDDANDVAFFGSYAYVADIASGLQIIDVSNVSNPMLAGFYNTPGWASGVALSGNYAYVADGGGYSLQIIDVSVRCPTNSRATTSSSSTNTKTSSSTLTISGTQISPSITLTASTNPAVADNTSTFSTTLEKSEASASGGSSFLWIIGLAIGGIICLGVTGGTVYILRRRRQNSSNRRETSIGDGSKTHSSFELEPVKKGGHAEIGREYYQLSKISKEEAQRIYASTGHLIVFPEGKDRFEYVIGEGNFGKIKVAQRIEDSEYVASKKVKGEENMRASEEEANIQREAAGGNVLPIYNTIKLEESLYHFMPLAGYGSGREIQKHLSALNNHSLATEIITFVIKDVLTGLRTIHSKGIYHLDIKLENIVFTKAGIAYITDFGCAKKAAGGKAQISWNAIGDNRYFSPERLQACKKRSAFDGEKADLWAAGMMVLQMIDNLSPIQLFEMAGDFNERVQVGTQDFFIAKLKRFKELQYPEEGSIWWVIKRLLDPNAETRLTADRALQASCFSGLGKETQAHRFKDLKAERLMQETGMGEKASFYISQDHKQFYAQQLPNTQEYEQSKSEYVYQQ